MVFKRLPLIVESEPDGDAVSVNELQLDNWVVKSDGIIGVVRPPFRPDEPAFG